ncbi:MAG: 2-succinyl-5-enolpyruvyl-6-hydroxy-3-cyclohexene-1-carboxylic-acid synthase [Candidatus Nanopelagicaceae bacterium]|nr:2-succinyl-5-enolpyruvyl-6-hydroxy-3-cyclohexene-1-carboxylic-acid synthase [Candidatus Nanopelagicaceae bacterium]
MSISTNLARKTVRQLIELGIEDAVLSPGSRNAPLSIALYQAEQKGLIRLHVRIDERGAAFFALGITKATGKYVPVVCTSGTAVANYYPAVMEAHHSDNNLLLLTADRPARLRNTGSNQTTLQAKIFGEFVRHSVDTPAPIDLENLLNGSGPVHINLQFDEPLLPEDSLDWLAGIHHKELAPTPTHKTQIDVAGKRNIVIVGHDRAGFSEREIEKLAHDLGAPLITEDPLRFKDAIAHSPILLSDERVRKELKPDLAIVIGRTTLSRSTNAYLGLAEKTLVIDPRIKVIDTARSADQILEAIPTIRSRTDADQSWIQTWRKYEALAKEALTTYPDWSEGALASLVAADLENESALFVSSSRPIRDLEAFAIPRADVTTYANRGLAGIDGNISTAMGIAAHHDETFAIIGDLAFLHDISALSNPIKDVLTIIVVDNNGGGIFSTLPQQGVEGFERIFGTPHDRDIAKIVTGFGISNEVVASAKELHIALQRIHPNVHVIVAKMPDREANADFLKSAIERYKKSVVL